MGGLKWHFNILSKKWELLDSRDSRHRCQIKLDKSQNKVNNTATRNFKNDPLIKKALAKFEKQLDKERPKTIYWLKRT